MRKAGQGLGVWILSSLSALALAACGGQSSDGTASNTQTASATAGTAGATAAASLATNGTAGDSAAGNGAAGNASNAELPACSWPAALNPPQTTRGQCTAARVELSCLGSNGVTEDCFTDNLQSCPDQSNVAVPNAVCHSICKPNEYAVACGSVGPGPIADPPAGCTMPLSTPAGIVDWCCPCNAG
jgi:hypothetical protein